MSTNRRRNETLTVRLTKTEKSEIITKAKRSKMNLTEYIVALTRQTEIVLPPDTAPIIIELKRIGNNLNQIAAKVNSGAAYVPDLKSVIENQNRVYDLLLNLSGDKEWQQ